MLDEKMYIYDQRSAICSEPKSFVASFARADVLKLVLRIAIFFTIAASFFNGIIPVLGSARVPMLCLAVATAFLYCLQKGGKVYITLAGASWIAFVTLCAFNQGQELVTGSDAAWLKTVVLIICLAICIAFEWDKWSHFMLEVVVFSGVVCAIATILFFIVPWLYDAWFKPFFYADSVNATGYMSGLASHYSLNGMYLAWGLLAAWTALLTSPRTERVKWCMATVIVFVALLLTSKRAHLLFGVCCCVIQYLIMHSRDLPRRVLSVLYGMLVIVVLVAVASMFVPQLAQFIVRFEGLIGDDSFGGRSNYYEMCLDLYRESPLIGSGWNAFTDRLYSSGILDLRRLYAAGNLNQNAHNVFLQLLAEEGALGLLLFLTASLWMLVKTVRVLRSSTKKEVCGAPTASALFSVGVQCFFLMYCFTGNPLYEPVEYIIYLLVCLPLSFWHFASMEEHSKWNASLPGSIFRQQNEAK